MCKWSTQKYVHYRYTRVSISRTPPITFFVMTSRNGKSESTNRIFADLSSPKRSNHSVRFPENWWAPGVTPRSVIMRLSKFSALTRIGKQQLGELSVDSTTRPWISGRPRIFPPSRKISITPHAGDRNYTSDQKWQTFTPVLPKNALSMNMRTLLHFPPTTFHFWGKF